MINNSVINLKINPQNSRTVQDQQSVFGIIITLRQLSCLLDLLEFTNFTCMLKTLKGLLDLHEQLANILYGEVRNACLEERFCIEIDNWRLLWFSLEIFLMIRWLEHTGMLPQNTLRLVI